MFLSPLCAPAPGSIGIAHSIRLPWESGKESGKGIRSIMTIAGLCSPPCFFGSMLGYGTRREPLMALGARGFSDIYAAIHAVGTSRRRHQPVN